MENDNFLKKYSKNRLSKKQEGADYQLITAPF